MHLFSLGLNHTTAPLALRERVAFPPEQVTAALRDLAHRFNGVLTECAIVSTCNRTELYAVTDEPALAGNPDATHPLCVWLAESDGVSVETLVPHLYAWRQGDAVRHAFRVACGLDSMVLGEPQILGQMKQAARDAEDAGTMGTLLHQVFQRTFSVAKEVRSSTQIGAHSVSMAAAAVRLAQRIFERIDEQHVLFIGAGEMIELTATHFAAQQPKSMTIANRTLERGEKLAAHFGARAIRLADLPEHLADYDIVVSCTASSLPIIGLGMIERATRQRRHKPMFMVDLAVPRDIEAEAARLDDIYLYTVDDLGKIVATGMENRQAAVAQADAIIETEVQQFMRWLDARSMVPVIRDLHAQGEALRQSELERARRMLARGEDPATVLEALSHGLTNKFLHGPTQLLHSAPDEARAHLIDYLPRLFQTNERK